jgi:2-oxo-4-hydroxy-4-carboxy-5-ureidoimidazoline decarboxylase
VDLDGLNALPAAEAEAALLECCASPGWAAEVAAGRPYGSVERLLMSAEDAWWAQHPDEWLQAFAAHPRIGERREGDDRHSAWSRTEQSGAVGAGQATLDALAACNATYEERFGRVYLVFASGKTADEMLALCRERLGNDPTDELIVAAGEQARITALRLRRLVGIG